MCMSFVPTSGGAMWAHGALYMRCRRKIPVRMWCCTGVPHVTTVIETSCRLRKKKLVILDGLQDYIVTDSENVLLICRKSEEQRIRQFVNDAKTRFGNEYT